MPVETERLSNPVFAHQLKTSAIDQTQLLPTCCNQGRNGRFVNRRRNPFDANNGQDIFLEQSQRLNSDSYLQKSARFDDDIVAGDQPRFGCREPLPNARCSSVVFVATVQNRVKRGRVDKNISHETSRQDTCRALSLRPFRRKKPSNRAECSFDTHFGLILAALLQIELDASPHHFRERNASIGSQLSKSRRLVLRQLDLRSNHTTMMA